MTLTLEVTPEQETRLHEEAARRGVPLEQLTGTLLDELLTEWEQDAAQDEADAAVARYRLANPDPRPRRTLADLRAHIEALDAQSATAHHDARSEAT